jgi:hypothetical protein
LILPVIVMALTELVKRLPAFPATPYRIKLVCLIIAVLVTIGLNYSTFTNEYLTLVAEVIVLYTSAIGIYENTKNLLKKI